MEGLWLVPSQLAGRHCLHAHVRLLGSGTEPNAFDYCAVFGHLPDAVSAKDGDRRIVQCEIRDGALGSDRCDVKATMTESPDQCPCLGVHPAHLPFTGRSVDPGAGGRLVHRPLTPVLTDRECRLVISSRFAGIRDGQLVDQVIQGVPEGTNHITGKKGFALASGIGRDCEPPFCSAIDSATASTSATAAEAPSRAAMRRWWSGTAVAGATLAGGCVAIAIGGRADHDRGVGALPCGPMVSSATAMRSRSAGSRGRRPGRHLRCDPPPLPCCDVSIRYPFDADGSRVRG